MQRKILTIMLALLLVFTGAAGVVSANSANPGYTIRAAAEGSSATVQIIIERARATVGRFALAYDTDKVQLMTTSGSAAGSSAQVADVVAADSVITLAPQNGSDGQGVSVSDGYVMFAWYATGSRVEAEDAAQTIATLHFTLKDGVTAEDFNSRTFRLHTFAAGEYPQWLSGAYISLGPHDRYWSSADGYPQCIITKDYPNSDVQPIDTYPAAFTVIDAEGAPVSGAAVQIEGTDYTADDTGSVSIDLADGVYNYTVSQTGYEAKNGTITIAGAGIAETVTIRSDLQYVTEFLTQLTITYADGEHAGGVKSSIGLAAWNSSSETLTWTSSNPSVITNLGIVTQPESDTVVTMTATFAKGTASASREFRLTVLKKGATVIPPDPGTETDPVITPNPTPTPEPPQSKFTDLGAHKWAEEAINKLTAAGIIYGTSETTYEPGAEIRRGDFTALIVRMFRFEAEIDGNFADVPEGSYYYNEIAVAKALGLAAGTGNGNFDPNGSITRQDMMAIVLRAAKYYGLELEPVDADAMDHFIDTAEIADYAYEAVKELVCAGLIAGNGAGEIMPRSTTTRAEVAVFLEQIYRLIG